MNIQLKTVSREVPYVGDLEITDDLDYSWTYTSSFSETYLLISVPGGYVWATIGPNIIRTTPNDICFQSKARAIAWVITNLKGIVQAHDSLIDAIAGKPI